MEEPEIRVSEFNLRVELEPGPPQPEFPNSIVYCTVKNEQGSYDIELKDKDGNVFTVLDRICILYDEYLHEQEGRFIKWTTLVGQSESSVHGNPGKNKVKKKDLILETELFLKADPQLSLARFDTGWISRRCGSTSYSPSGIEYFGDTTEILPQAAQYGLLHITWRNYFGCPEPS